MTTETPKTDTATDALDVACYPVALYAVAGFADFVKFARKLETDRAALIEALDLATATVELYTGNGAQSRPWLAACCVTGDDHSEPDVEKVAKSCRATLAKVQA
jgi:hypothetical protein